MEETWRWFGPDDVVQLASHPAGGCDWYRHGTASHSLWRGLERRGDREAQGADRCRSKSRSALERRRKPADPRAHQARRRRSRAAVRQLPAVDAQPRRLRYPHHLLQFHADPRLDPHRSRVAGCRWRHGAPLRSGEVLCVRLLHGRATGRRRRPRSRSGRRARIWFDRASESRQGGAARQRQRRLARRLRSLRHSRTCDACSPATTGSIGRPAGEFCALSARGDPDRRGGRHPHGVHPDDPPRPLFGLPRIVSTGDDLAVRHRAPYPRRQRRHLLHRLARCRRTQRRARTGERFAAQIHFAHLRNVAKEPDGSFVEAEHLARRYRYGRRRPRCCLPSRSVGEAAAWQTGASRFGPITATSCSTTSGARRTRAIR